MKKIVVATDFSERSDRAVRRATLLARAFDAAIFVVHVVDDDQPLRVVSAEHKLAAKVLAEKVRSLRAIDGLDCAYRVVLGDPFEAIGHAAQDLDAELIVLGPYRRQLLKDVFVGTTAERVVRNSNHPVLMANGVPAGPYRHVLIAVDLSAASADVVQAVKSLGLSAHATVSVLHVFHAPMSISMSRSLLPGYHIDEYEAGEEDRAAAALAGFLRDAGLEQADRITRVGRSPTAFIISEIAHEVSADLIVVGTRGHTGMARFMLGSVAGELLRVADRDVLAVPPGTKIPDAARGAEAQAASV